MAAAPRPRFRLYTSPRVYASILGDVALARTTSGGATQSLEAEVCGRFSTPYALALPQARVGIYLAIQHLISPGQNVVLSPYTIADVINMVICAGGVPVFADIDRATTNVAADEIDRLIDADTGAVLVTHLHGIPADVETIARICEARRVPLIEDCSQALGACVNGRPVGTFGEAGVFSFGLYKNVTGFYGGMLITSNETLHQEARRALEAAPYIPLAKLLGKVAFALSTDVATFPPLFKSLVYPIFRFGYLRDIDVINRLVSVELDASRKEALPDQYLCRMRPAQARLVLRQLPLIDGHARKRIEYARMYFEGLTDLPGLLLPPLRTDGTCVYNYFPIQYRQRRELVKWLMHHRRDVAVQHLKNCAALESFAPEAHDCPNADQTANEVILLPNYPRYGEEEVRTTIDVMRAFFHGRTSRAA